MVLSGQTTLAAVLVLASLASPFDPPLIKQAHHSPSLLHWNSSIDLIETKQSNLSHIFVYPLAKASLSFQITHHFSTLSFKLKSRTSSTVCNVILEGVFTPKPSFKERCPVASLSAEISDYPLFIQLDVHANSDGFAIWDILGDETVHIPISKLTLRSQLMVSVAPLETFILRTSTNPNASVYFSLSIDPDLPDGHDRCIGVSSSLYDTEIDTIYALECWASSNRSLKVTRKDGAFCLRKELFAQSLGRVQVTFTVTNLAKLLSELPGNGNAPLLFTLVRFWAEHDALFGRFLNPEKKFASFGADQTWLFYHPNVFQYNVTSNSSKAIQICDMLANCYQMEEVVNGTVAKDGSKQYIVPEKVHSLLKYSPVVRMLTDDSKAKLETQYFSGQDETISRVLSHLTSEGIPAQLLEYELSLRYATNSTISKPSSSHAPNVLSLPMHLIDQRVQEFYITLNSSQSDLYLESIRLQFGSGSSLNHTYLNLSLAIGSSKTFRTQDFFRPKIHTLPWAGTQLTGFQIAYRAIGGKAVPEGNDVEVGVEIEVDTFDHHYESGAVFTNFRPEVTFEDFDYHYSPPSRDGQKNFTLTNANSTRLLLSNWIPANPVPDTDSWFSNQGHIRLAYRSVDGKMKLHQGDLRVKQIIWGFAEGYVEEKELVHREDSGNYFYEEIRMQRKLLNDRYRIGYLISLADTAQVGAGVYVDFEPNFEEITNALPSSPLCQGPTYGDVICRVEPYTCPEYYFKVNENTGNCEMVN